MLGQKALAARALQPQMSSFPRSRILAQAGSGLPFDAWSVKAALKAGFAIALYVSLAEYDVGMERRVRVWAEVTRPDQSTFTIPLTRDAEGLYSAGFLTTAGGVHRCRLRADGCASKGASFSREKTLTVGSI